MFVFNHCLLWLFGGLGLDKFYFCGVRLVAAASVFCVGVLTDCVI